MHSKTILMAYLAATFLLVTVGLEAETPKVPPSTYELGDVTIQLVKHLGGRNSIVFEISGAGSGSVRRIGYQGTLEVEGSEHRPGQTCTFQLDTAAVLDLINAFHAIYFFDLAERYSFPYRAVLGDDGKVQTEFLSQSHGGGSTVTIQIQDYSKTSGFYVEGPRELKALAKQIASISESACAASASN